MLTNAAGGLLVAAPPLGDPNFDRTIVYVIEHTTDGALGLVLNRPSTETPPDVLAPWLALHAPPQVMFSGGPVETHVLIGVAERTGPDHVRPDAPLTAHDDTVIGTVDLSEPPAADVVRLRVFRGYSGWSPGQLDAELLAGAWLVVPAEPADVFTAAPGELWRSVLRRQGGSTAWLANAPHDLSLN